MVANLIAGTEKHVREPHDPSSRTGANSGCARTSGRLARGAGRTGARILRIGASWALGTPILRMGAACVAPVLISLLSRNTCTDRCIECMVLLLDRGLQHRSWCSSLSASG